MKCAENDKTCTGPADEKKEGGGGVKKMLAFPGHIAYDGARIPMDLTVTLPETAHIHEISKG
ncbi:hypothetical protein [Candidatus Formimonas warabiya]|uniref:Uncharacterized protein n=1 Tax=Formimonas warabiya TaxID=1761012 RepID=A0A3G1KW86_FORW1|nr:hypothetical protein [Candidatus Formimonas warabiya]ATW26629.1 hypothetical protein DCMF_19400 [Candidatus Formimonas warabiya]